MHLNNRPVAVIFTSIIASVFIFNATNAQIIEKGKIIDTLFCLNKKESSYSLYLPSGYNIITIWPLIMIFDPSARGAIAVETFRTAAEKYGYVLACSHNARNGPLNNNFVAADQMLMDVRQRFKINEKRIYTSGFSGGARVALAYAVAYNNIAGIIGCGAGLPGDKTLYPSVKSSFVYFGTAGNRDMNFMEMNDLDDQMKTIGITSFLRTFDGIHEWPPNEIIIEAVEWLELQAMKKGLKPVNTLLISTLINKMKTMINNLDSRGDIYDAVRYLRYAVRDFSDQPAASELNKKLDNLEKSNDYTIAVKNWNKSRTREENYIGSYINYIGKIINSGSVADTAIKWCKTEIESQNNLVKNGNPANSQMASRILNLISIFCSEQGTGFYRNGRFDFSTFFFTICTFSDSENMNNYFNLARSLSSLNKKNEAIIALSTGIKLGYDKELIKNEPAFKNLKDDGRFKAMVKK